MTVNKIMVHADYNELHRMGSDITLLQLHRHVEFSSHILPACLTEPITWLAPDSSCWISGWGMVTEDAGMFLRGAWSYAMACLSMKFLWPPPILWLQIHT
ncbi:TISP43 isoform 1 [Pan troglodytes]|uniref:TISP43 isoform 1 n=2 Tax=Pan troglodytes TaxID=9598 RepID=A0A6D2XYF8_PANTR|nr:TISP43 isoform 1 [Pan troglodytes]